MKAVVFCRFQGRFAESLKDNLTKHDLDIVHFGDVTTATKMKDPKVPLVILFRDMISHNDAEYARELAVRWGARFVLLTRKKSEWPRLLPKHNPPLPGQPPPPSYLEYLPPEVDASHIDEMKETSPETNEEWEEDRELLLLELEECIRVNKELSEALASSRTSEGTALNMATEAETNLHNRIKRLEADVVFYRTRSLETIAASVRTLVAVGFITEREAADRLLGIVLKSEGDNNGSSK